MLRLPVLCSIFVLLCIEFQLYWVVRTAIAVLELLPKVRLVAWWLPVPIPRPRWTFTRRRIAQEMANAKDYDTWKELAVKMDELHGQQGWKKVPESRAYHFKIVRTASERLRKARASNDVYRVMETLTPCMVKNFGGSMNLQLYSQTHVGTKQIVEDLMHEITVSLDWLMAVTPEQLREGHTRPSPESLGRRSRAQNGDSSPAAEDWAARLRPRDESLAPKNPSRRSSATQSFHTGSWRVDPHDNVRRSDASHRTTMSDWDLFIDHRDIFFKQAKRAFGNTALLLSGGATLGIYHIGVLKALANTTGFPKVVCGTSAGAVLAAFMAVRTDEEIRTTVNDPELSDWWNQFGSNGPFYGSWLWKTSQVIKQGRIYDYVDFMRHLKWFCGETTTFREAFERTGRLVNITCTPHKTAVKGSPPLILNFLTAPDVTLASAVCASSCVPMLIQPVALLEKGLDGKLRPFTAHNPEASDLLHHERRVEVAPSVGPLPEANLSERIFEPPTTPRRPRRDAAPRDIEDIIRESTLLSGEDESFEVSMEHIVMRDGTFESDVPVQAISELFNCHFSIVSQVNPHIVPFFYHNRGQDGRPSTWRLWAGGWRGGFVLSAFELWLKEDMLKNLRFLAGLDLLLEVFGVDWSYLWIQEARGDVTLVPDVRAMDYAGLIDNLSSRRELHRKVNSMEKNTWQCLSRISNRMMVQSALDRACEALGISDL